MAVRYPIRAVSRLTGISLDTLRAWERRYKVVTPERSDRGRLYSDSEIQRLLLLRDVVNRGHAIGQVSALSNEDLKVLGQRSEHAVRGSRGVEETNNSTLSALIKAIEMYDAAAANEEIGKLAALLPARDLVTQVALPLMRVVGERWHRGSMTIAHEHMASGILRNLFGSLLRLYKPLTPIVKIILATPSGEHHEFGILAAAMLAAPLGLEPVYLGASLPAEEILSAAEKCGARVILIGLVDQAEHADGLRELRSLAADAPENMQLWLGGRDLQDQPQALRDRIQVMGNFEVLEQALRGLRGV